MDSGEEQTVLYDLRPEILQFSKSGSQLVCGESGIAVWDLTRNDKQVQNLGRFDGIIPLSNGQILIRSFRENSITISLLSDRTD